MSMTRLFYRYKSHTRVKSFPFGPRDHCRSTFAPASGGLTGAEIHRLHIASTALRGDIERWSPHACAVEPLRETHRMLSTYHELALTSV